MAGFGINFVITSGNPIVHGRTSLVGSHRYFPRPDRKRTCHAEAEGRWPYTAGSTRFDYRLTAARLADSFTAGPFVLLPVAGYGRVRGRRDEGWLRGGRAPFIPVRRKTDSLKNCQHPAGMEIPGGGGALLLGSAISVPSAFYHPCAGQFCVPTTRH